MNAVSLPRWTTSPGVFLLDAVVTASMAIGLLIGASSLASPLGLPDGLLRWSAFILLPFAATVTLFAARRSMPLPAMWAIIGCNLLWVADSAVLLATDWVQPTSLGRAFVIAQAAGVAFLAAWEIHVARSAR